MHFRGDPYIREPHGVSEARRECVGHVVAEYVRDSSFCWSTTPSSVCARSCCGLPRSDADAKIRMLRIRNAEESGFLPVRSYTDLSATKKAQTHWLLKP